VQLNAQGSVTVKLQADNPMSAQSDSRIKNL
jgi:hypothetical protein